jgi:hypothetical protein
MIKHCPTAEMAEGIAILEGVKAILATATSQVIVECDNANVIDELKMKDKSKSQMAFILLDAKELLNMLPRYKVQKVNRVGNYLARDIASF